MGSMRDLFGGLMLTELVKIGSWRISLMVEMVRVKISANLNSAMIAGIVERAENTR